MNKIKLLSALVAVFAVSGCATTGGGTPAEKRASINEMRQNVLAELYRKAPDTRARTASAPGYAVFSNANVNVILASFGGEIVADKVTVYQLTESGLALQATLKGTKYWRANELN